MDNAAAALLVADLKTQWRVVEHVYDRLEQRRAASQEPAHVEALGYQLHNLYGSLEHLFELIARAFENQIDARRYHVDLLHRMRTHIEGVRPALLSADLESDLNQLRAFRHFFRHAYGVELKPEQVAMMADVAAAMRDPLRAALDRFAADIIRTAS